MDTIRYVLGVVLVVFVPPGIFFWYLIHPLAALWRKVGLWVTYGVVGMLCVALSVALFLFREVLLGPDLGTHWILWIPGVFLYGLSAWISILSFRSLTLRTFLGVPELSSGIFRGILLQDGAYGVVRHPRYASALLGVAGLSFLVNYLGVYLMVIGTVPALLLLIFLEEQELRKRFGPAFDRYRDSVPVLIPRSGHRSMPRKEHADRVH